ncbi:DUF1404 domain-containing protein [Acidianus brierleyi]|uniref:DUF1404 domain-containing protein n=1 Tax=Acidianus brierleyi TaxID=41673 RepID=A0A2U9IB48_9CREN|nr:DUF1404 domain-containing protein [Acidianus brierleyi]AWR93238.1 DUF1404 domain-containing protein [Acidianus brierleyi]
MKLDKEKVKFSHFIPPIILLALVLNPLTESQEFLHEWLFMVSHYVLFIGGLLLSYKVIKGSTYWIIPSAFLVSFWHVPYFFALAGAFTFFRALNDFSLILAGILAGISASRLSLFSWLSLIIIWMLADTILSIVFLLEFPAYSNAVYKFSPYSESQEFNTAISMWIVMSAIIVYVFGKFLKELLF